MSISLFEAARLWSINRLAIEFDLDRRTVTRRLAAGGVHPDGKGPNGYAGYLLKRVARLLCDPLPGGDADPDQMDPHSRLRWFQSEHERLKLAEREGDLIPVEECRTVYADIVKLLVAAVESLPDRLERDAGLTPAQVEAMERALRGVRQELYDRLMSLDDDPLARGASDEA